jgi:hypothetical protein
MFDVLEHLPNEDESLSKIVELLHINGRLLLTVPAHQSLWSYFDEISHHYRRYEKDCLSNLLRQHGLQIEYSTFFQCISYPLVWLSRRLNIIFTNPATLSKEKKYQLALRELKVKPIVNEILYALSLLEKNVINHRWQLPFGTSILVVARKTQ